MPGWSEAARGFGGTIADFPLTSVLQILELGRKSGFLYVRSFPKIAFLVFREGGVIQAVSSMRRVGLGELLIGHGLIQRKHLDLALETQKLSKTPKVLGAIFEDLGYVTHEQIVKVLSDQMRETVRWTLRWQEGEFTYYPEKTEKLKTTSDEEEMMLPVGIVVEEVLTEMISDSDRRKWPRVPISLKVVHRDQGQTHTYFTHNVSGGGLYILSDNLPLAGATQNLELWIPSLLEPTPITIRVIRVADGTGRDGRGYAVEFTSIDEEARSILEGLGQSLGQVL